MEDEGGFALSCRETGRPSSLSSTPRRVDSLRVRLALDSGCISVLNVTLGDGSFLGSGAGELERDLVCGSTASLGCGGCCSSSLSIFYCMRFILTAGESVIYIIQRTSTSWYNSVAFWWKPETSSSVFLGSFDLDGAFLVSLL